MAAEKRRTVFPGNELKELIGSRKRRAISPPVSPVSPSLFVSSPSPPISPVPPVVFAKRLETDRLPIGPLLPIKADISENSQTQVIDDDPVNSYDSVIKESPSKSYRSILTEDQAGLATVAHRNSSAFSIVAIRKRKGPYRQGCISKCSHKNVVALYEAFFYEGSFYFVYEPMTVSLEAIQSVPGDRIMAFEIAAISKEVLHGLRYLHDALKIAHGSVTSANIMLDLEANVKLADSMLNSSSSSKQNDLLDLGIMVFHMMEPDIETTAETPLIPKHQGDWNQDILTFLKRTKTASVRDLLQDEFLKLSPGSMCLKPRILIAERAWFREWEICVADHLP